MPHRWLALGCLLLIGCSGSAPDRTIDPVPDAEVELTLVQDGVTMKLYRGGIYRVNPESGRWDFVAEGYDPGFYGKNYVERGGEVFRRGRDGTEIRVGKEFSDDFENAGTIRDLIGPEHGWTTLTVQSPKTPSVPDYVDLRKRILAGQADFLDNRIEPGREIVHSGRTALRAYSVPRSADMLTNKASLGTERIHFVRGDDVWFSGWFQVPEESGMPFTLMDLETTWFREAPGIRIMAFGDRYLGVELKWGAKPKYRQARGREIAFPRAKWVEVRLHATLSEGEDGAVELWQDGTKIVDARGQTLPLAHTVLNSLEVGISAYGGTVRPATLYVDDVTISDRPPD